MSSPLITYYLFMIVNQKEGKREREKKEKKRDREKERKERNSNYYLFMIVDQKERKREREKERKRKEREKERYYNHFLFMIGDQVSLEKINDLIVLHFCLNTSLLIFMLVVRTCCRHHLKGSS